MITRNVQIFLIYEFWFCLYAQKFKNSIMVKNTIGSSRTKLREIVIEVIVKYQGHDDLAIVLVSIDHKNVKHPLSHAKIYVKLKTTYVFRRNS